MRSARQNETRARAHRTEKRATAHHTRDIPEHDGETNERKLERSQSSLRLAQLEDVAHAIGLITTAPRSPGRKPLGYREINKLEAAKAWVAEDAYE